MKQTLGYGEKVKLLEMVARIVGESPFPTKIEIVLSERGLSVSSFELRLEDEIAPAPAPQTRGEPK